MAGPDASLAGLHCLVLDDEFLIALDIQTILESASAANVICVANAVDAMKALYDNPALDLAILDLKLGGRRETSIAIAALLAERGTPFVFLTGMHGDDTHTRQFPHVPVVEKPYQAALLLSAIMTALSGRRAKD